MQGSAIGARSMGLPGTFVSMQCQTADEAQAAPGMWQNVHSLCKIMAKPEVVGAGSAADLAQQHGVVHAHGDVFLPDQLGDASLLQQVHDLARGVANHRLDAPLLVRADPVLHQHADIISEQ